MDPNETKGESLDDEEMDMVSCPTCGRVLDDWPNPQGFKKADEVYCCQGCAEGTGCICDEEPEASTQIPLKESKNQKRRKPS